MIILFGWNKNAERLGEVCTAYCYDCQKEVPWEVGRVTEWVSFFAVPTIPFKREHFIFCGKCGDDFELSKKEFKNVHSIMCHSDAIDHTSVKDALFKTIEQKQLAEKSEIQMRWIKANLAREEHLKTLREERE